VNDGLDFSELSDDERAAAQQQATEAASKPDWPAPPPRDAKAPEAAAARLFGSPPDAMWPYRDVNGAILFWVCRWNVEKDGKPEKVILPLSWLLDGGWRFGHWPAPRPLYKLDEIQSNPDAPIVVVEGEAKADKAARVFPSSIITTSCGGARAAGATDWSPLASRSVVIWRDNDEAGAAYERRVAAELAELGSDVAIVDVAALVQIDGGSRGPDFDPVGWDVANAINEWEDLDALRRAVGGLVKPFDPGPAYVSFGPYTMSAGGLTVQIQRGKGAAKWTETVSLAAPFEVLGLCRDPHGQGWGKLLRWRDADGADHDRYVGDAAMHGDQAALCAGLADGGLRINRAYQRPFAHYLSQAQVKRRVTVVQRTGWYEIGGRLVFVLPRETIGQRGSERVILDAAASGTYEARGTVDQWRGGAAKLASGHILPVLAVSTALAGTLAHLVGYEGGGVHFHGPSSIGKTTALRLAASVWGRGDTPGYVRSWRATANGLEGAAACASDTALILDELGQAEARELAAALYMLANGGGKARARRDGSLRESSTWRVLTLSSGELPVDVKLTEDRGRKPRAGQLVRMLDIPADRGLGFGIFDVAGPDHDAVALAKRCKLAAGSAYGTAGPEFVRLLIAGGVTGDDVRALVNDFVAANVPHGAEGQVNRAAQRLGLIAAAGELATNLGLTGWRAGEACSAAAWGLKQWIERRGGLEPAEVRQGIEQVRRFFEAHSEARFDGLDNPDALPVSNRAGWRKGHGEDRRWFVPPETWKTEVCAGLDPHLAARVLAQRGMIEKASDGYQRVWKIQGKSQRGYVITPRIFDGGEE
jgi:uncharacterized protein (DUF927 family)